ncbi:pyridoxamine 5'-phosphate oxidase family protein, partial [Streptomyces cellulosae]
MTATQRRGRKIMMTPGELDDFLTEQRTCRVATVSADGMPHVSTLWFVWDGVSMWLYSVVRSRRFA